jgi:hypothetical protein
LLARVEKSIYSKMVFGKKWYDTTIGE